MSNKSTMLLEHHLKELKLPTFLREYDKLATQCATEGADHPDYLLRLSELELIDRHHRMVDRRIKAARFPTTKSLDTFDFLSMPSLNKALVLELDELGFVPLSKAGAELLFEVFTMRVYRALPQRHRRRQQRHRQDSYRPRSRPCCMPAWTVRRLHYRRRPSPRADRG